MLRQAFVADAGSVRGGLTFPLWQAARCQLPLQEPRMIHFDVPDMSCGHCVAAITRAVQAVDPQARVEVDLAARRVRVDPAQADADALAAAIRDAGYAPSPVTAARDGTGPR
jgi:copper chaperone CopZ